MVALTHTTALENEGDDPGRQRGYDVSTGDASRKHHPAWIGRIVPAWKRVAEIGPDWRARRIGQKGEQRSGIARTRPRRLPSRIAEGEYREGVDGHTIDVGARVVRDLSNRSALDCGDGAIGSLVPEPRPHVEPQLLSEKQARGNSTNEASGPAYSPRVTDQGLNARVRSGWPLCHSLGGQARTIHGAAGRTRAAARSSASREILERVRC